MVSSKRVLVCPLDWGLGHATRSMVVIRELLRRGHQVEIASSGIALRLLQMEFPELATHRLPAYDVRYAAGNSIVLPMMLQSLRIMDTIRKEHDETERLVSTRSLDAVISDNRYGCWSRRVPGAFITHQLSPKLPPGMNMFSGIVRRKIDSWIRNFDYCWVPDEPGNLLSGELSVSAGTNARFVGILSRMQRLDPAPRSGVLILLSGPEPQRTILEKLLLAQAERAQVKFTMVRGLPGDAESNPPHIHNHLPIDQLNQLINVSEFVVCRSGYSTIMDLAVVGGLPVFIPTPGQTEQEYLARRLEKQGVAGFQHQDRLSLAEALNTSRHYQGFVPASPSSHLLSREIDILLQP